MLGVLGQAAGAPLQVRLCCGLLAPEANLAVDTRVAILQGEAQRGTAATARAASFTACILPTSCRGSQLLLETESWPMGGGHCAQCACAC